MTTDEVIRRLRAFEQGKPLPSGEKLRVRRLESEQILILAFVKMGGESAPWGVAYGRPGTGPTVRTVAEPRSRDAVADMMLEFAPALLVHLHHPQISPFGADPDARLPPFQVWLPNDTHLEMLHHLAYAYTFTKFGEPERWHRLQMLGRACGWLFREAQRPGQMTVMVGSRVLTDAYTFPAETTRQGHLGFLLAWLQANGDRAARMAAAAEAEQGAVSTSLDPALERDELAPFLERFHEARDGKDTERLERAQRRIHKELDAELRRRFSLTEAAIGVISTDPRTENAALPKFVEASMDEHRRQYRRMEQQRDDKEDGPAFTASPETDRYPAAAASRYYVHESSQEYLDTMMVHDDRELQARLVATGQAIAGTIAHVRDEGEKRKTVPVWTVDSRGDLPLRVREGAELCVVGLPSRKVRIRHVARITGQGYRFELVVTALITTPRRNDGSVLPAADPRLRGTRVMLVKPSMDGIARRKSMRVWKRDVPGAWLTHAVPATPESRLPQDVAENLGELGAQEP